MSKITLIVQSAIFPAKAEPLREILEELIVHCKQTEPGLLKYDWYLNEEETRCQVLEVYENSEALLFHFQNYAPFRERMNQCRKMEEVRVLGNPSAELKALLDTLGAVNYRPFIKL